MVLQDSFDHVFNKLLGLIFLVTGEGFLLLLLQCGIGFFESGDALLEGLIVILGEFLAEAVHS